MSFEEILTHKDKVTQRKSLTATGWVLLFVGVLFIGALGLGLYRQLTHNPSPLASASAIAEPTEAQISPTATLAITPTQTVTWTVSIMQNQLGITVAQVPPEVATKALSDYLGAIQWWDTHLYDIKYLRAHLAEYFAGEQLAFLQSMLDWETTSNIVVPMGQDQTVPPGHQVQFSADGAHAFVMDYLAAGDSIQYDMKTKARKPGTAYKSRMAVTELVYDAAAQRWKIMHGVALIDLETHQIIWQAQ